jgi:hypothetical protein
LDIPVIAVEVSLVLPRLRIFDNPKRQRNSNNYRFDLSVRERSIGEGKRCRRQSGIGKAVGCPMRLVRPAKLLAYRLTAPRWLSFLVGSVVTGVGLARQVEFYGIAAFVASGRKATKDETAQGQNDAAHLSTPGLADTWDGSLPGIAVPVKQARP